MKAQGRWKWRAVDAEENQLQVSLSAHRPWKSLRDFHIPSAPTTPAGRWKSNSRIPTFPPARFALWKSKNQIRKEARRRLASLPPPGSFFNEKMLSAGTAALRARDKNVEEVRI